MAHKAVRSGNKDLPDILNRGEIVSTETHEDRETDAQMTLVVQNKEQRLLLPLRQFTETNRQLQPLSAWIHRSRLYLSHFFVPKSV